MALFRLPREPREDISERSWGVAPRTLPSDHRLGLSLHSKGIAARHARPESRGGERPACRPFKAHGIIWSGLGKALEVS